MSLVSQSQQPGLGNGSNLTNGVAANGRATALGESINLPRNNGPQLGPSFDLWGMLQRRKYVIALFCIIGAALGYLNFVNSPKSYSSFSRLLITTQAPPSIVNGNVMVKQRNSIPNHTSLLVSELVLGNAVERGNLQNFKTFSKNGDLIGTLKQMLRVAPEEGDTLRVTCIGPQPDELPAIVNQVIDSYRRVIAEDSQNGSEQAVELIENLAGKLSQEKEELVSDRLKLWKELDISSMSEEGFVRNPHTRKLSELRTYKDEIELQLSDIRLRAKQLTKSLAKKEDTEAVDPLEIKIAAIEARDYLKVNYSNHDQVIPISSISTNKLSTEKKKRRN